MTVLRRAWFSGLLALATGVLLARTFELSPAGRQAPLWVVLPTFALLLVQLALDVCPRWAARARLLRTGGLAGPASAANAGGEAEREVPPADRPGRALRFVLWIGAFVGVVRLIGLFTAAPIFVGAHLRFEGRQGWRRSLGWAAGVGGVLWLLLEVGLGVRLPGGILLP